MEIRELEQKYLWDNRPFKTEKELLLSFSKDDIKNLITPLLEEYKYIDECISEVLGDVFSENRELDELSRYFMEEVVAMKHGWERKKELEIILKRFNSQLISRKLTTYKHYQRKLDIEEIDILAIISKYIQLPKSITRNIPCPFPHHEDKSPSFRIYPETNSFYCFWCGCGGNVLNFLSYMENITTKEAYKSLQDLV